MKTLFGGIFLILGFFLCIAPLVWVAFVVHPSVGIFVLGIAISIIGACIIGGDNSDVWWGNEQNMAMDYRTNKKY